TAVPVPAPAIRPRSVAPALRAATLPRNRGRSARRAAPAVSGGIRWSALRRANSTSLRRYAAATRAAAALSHTLMLPARSAVAATIAPMAATSGASIVRTHRCGQGGVTSGEGAVTEIHDTRWGREAVGLGGLVAGRLGGWAARQLRAQPRHHSHRADPAVPAAPGRAVRPRPPDTPPSPPPPPCFGTPAPRMRATAPAAGPAARRPSGSPAASAAST